MIMLELDYRVIPEVTEVYRLPFLLYIWVLLHQQPADVSKKETSVSVMRVCRSLRELMVYAVIPTPDEEVILEADAVK